MRNLKGMQRQPLLMSRICLALFLPLFGVTMPALARSPLQTQVQPPPAASQKASPLQAANGEPTQVEQVQVEKKITIAFDNADVKDVIRWASDLTTKNIIVHPGVQGKKITVVAGEPMARAEAWQVFMSALQLSGLAVVENGDTIKILPEPEAKTEKVPVGDESTHAGREEIVVRIIKIKNLAATQLINLLRPLTPNSAHFAAYPETNTLILADRAGNIDQIVNIINRIDKVGAVDIEIIKLDFASAKDVGKILMDLIAKTPGGRETHSPTALNITTDDRSNSILMTGDPVMRLQLRKLIQRLDQPLAGEGNTQVVYLNYITAKDMIPILDGVGGSAKKSAGAKDGGAQQVEVGIQALEQTNAVVLTAPPAMLKTMKGVLAKLDVRRKQVLVEALIVEVNTDVSRDLGVFWSVDGSGGFKANGLFPSGSATLPDFSKLVDGGLSMGIVKGGNLNAVIHALQKTTGANVLSTPTVTALDNEEAKILVGESVPFRTGVQNRSYGTGGTETPPSTPAQLYNNDFVSITREDIGITLKVKPRINQEDMLTLEIEQKVESIDNAANVGGESGASDIITQKREITTKALVRDGAILVLGGLIRNDVQTIESGVPFLSDIPILGHLFKGSTKKVTKKNLMVFIHPRILRDDEDIADTAGGNYRDLRNRQQRFNDTELRDYLHLNNEAELPKLPIWPQQKGSIPSRRPLSPVTAPTLKATAPVAPRS